MAEHIMFSVASSTISQLQQSARATLTRKIVTDCGTDCADTSSWKQMIVIMIEEGDGLMEVKMDVEITEIAQMIAQVVKHGSLEEVRILLPKLDAAIAAGKLRLTRDSKKLVQRQRVEKDAWATNFYR
ncbi:MAG: hypothetical protein F6K54_05755 [Okeania sp. SIO3B5]|uniref:hypothetical protein n=1 Tax=Okeania sp. SIO3B5 TaxID=2607811 RepID=UPI0014014A73|nr:hypothetical protein [Okeania sp. SIO3B5]NEO52622.1 hypothetical protein [Okeania sp. SIO3B5]